MGGEFRVAEVVIQENESLENALRRFKRKVQQEDIIKEIKKHSFYMKPGEKRRAKEALSRKRLRKKQRREADYPSLLVAARRRTSENQAPKAETFGFLLQLRARRPKGSLSAPRESGIPHVPRPIVQGAPIC